MVFKLAHTVLCLPGFICLSYECPMQKLFINIQQKRENIIGYFGFLLLLFFSLQYNFFFLFFPFLVQNSFWLKFCSFCVVCRRQQQQQCWYTHVHNELKLNYCKKVFFFLIHLFARDFLLMKKLKIKKTKPTGRLSFLDFQLF